MGWQTIQEEKWEGDSNLKLFKFMEGVSKHKLNQLKENLRKMNGLTVTTQTGGHGEDIGSGGQTILNEMGRYFETTNFDLKTCLSQEPNISPYTSKIFFKLNKYILDLRKQLQDQFLVRHDLEKALSYRPLSPDATTENSLPKVGCYVS
ncbi:hypothetical protein DVH24_021545 [Malus domestica]|uniref:Uncharacterized protein n=1 Tax=Malus domestica TaxID=3750 RepID=A0A498K0D2_MALDO|nr:hypothetical protein DVH24_021545 [Malus domestica]